MTTGALNVLDWTNMSSAIERENYCCPPRRILVEGKLRTCRVAVSSEESLPSGKGILRIKERATGHNDEESVARIV